MSGIDIYTRDAWGDEQAENYIRELDKTIKKLASGQSLHVWDRSKLAANLKSVQHRNHYHIFFEETGHHIRVLRILHQSRNWQKIMSD